MPPHIRGIIPLILLFLNVVTAITLPDSYNVVWTTQSRNSSESMPLGGADLGLNVWVENSTILFYIAKSGTFDDNNSLVKLGRVRLTITPDPFSGSSSSSSSFSQSLILNDGYIQITGQNGTTVINLWVDALNPVIHAEVNSSAAVTLTASFESWRYRNRLMSATGDYYEQAQSSWDYLPDANATTRADNISFSNGGVLMTHRNTNNSIFEYTLHEQGIPQYQDSMYNPILNNTYGLWMSSPDLSASNITAGFYVDTDYRSWNLVSNSTKTSYSLTIAIYQNQTDTFSDFQSQFNSLISNASANTQDATLEWWHSFWNRSYILINENTTSPGTDPGFIVGKNYQIFRYMQGCNAGGSWPMRFNGGLFTFDPVFVNSEAPYTPDYRRWTGGVFTAQNQRLVYWPLLKSGDFDLMKPEFEFYRRITPNAKLRGSVYFGIPNASLFCEQIESFGLPNLREYEGQTIMTGALRNRGFPEGIEWNSYIEWLQDTANEFVDMILQANMYTGMDISPYMDFVESQLRWFDLFYQYYHGTIDTYTLTASPINASNSGNGSLIIYPGTGCETYKAAYNPASTISGLKKVLSDLLQVAPNYVIANSSYYEGYLTRVPEVQVRYQQGHPCLSPAQAYTRIENVEIPQLYPVFPWGEYGLGQPTNLELAINTYLYDTETQSFHENIGWKQDVIWLTRMGLTSNATNMTIDRWSDSTVFRFPVFKGPNFDWAPDINHFGVASIALQEMLLQTFAKNNTQIRLLGAWPVGEWTARFKLYAPFNTTIEGVVDGSGSEQVSNLTVTPASRLADVVYGQD